MWNLQPACLNLLSARTTGLCHHAQSPGLMSLAMTLSGFVLPYQGQLLSELDNYPLVCSGQCNEVEHDQAARQDRRVIREPALPEHH